MDEPHKHNVELKKPDTKMSILYESIYIKCHTGKTNLWGRSQDSWDSCQWQVVPGGRHTWDFGNDLFFDLSAEYVGVFIL